MAEIQTQAKAPPTQAVPSATIAADTATPARHHADLLQALRQWCGDAAVLTDAHSLALASHDIFFDAVPPPLCVLRPRSVPALAAAVARITGAGLAVAPRGGGMSYTGGYLPQQSYVCVDLVALNAVLEVNTADMFITVQAGCTWAQVRDALAGSGLTTPYAGPLSGLRATVGGALSQNSMFFGAGQHGTAAETVLSMQVVLANGELLHTGSAAFAGPGASGFARWGGPDTTGLFVGDCGALGIKATATLRLIAAPTSQACASFGFANVQDMVGTQVGLMRQGLGTECFGIDAYKATHSAQTGNQLSHRLSDKLSGGVKTLSDIARSGPSLLSGLKAAAGVAMAGTDYLAVHPYSIHLALDGDSPAHTQDRLARVAKVAAAHNGTAQPASVPQVLRAQPFQPLRSVLAYNGDRWAPVHGIVPLSRALGVVQAVEALIGPNGRHAAAMKAQGIVYSPLTANLDRAFLFEPCFYWPDQIFPLHIDVLGESLTEPWRLRPPAPAARALVQMLWQETAECLDRFGAVHFQIGRAYDYLPRLQPPTRDLVLALKRQLDPRGLMNPGSLGLAAAAALAL
jgi:FAD/FMN-containing dehydrogenase